MIRIIRWPARIFFGLIALLLVLFIFLVTPAGFHTSLTLIEKYLPGKLTYSHISGNIFGPINLSNLVYDNGSIYLSMQQAHFEWRAPMLILKTIDISNLQATGIKVQFKNSKSKPANTEVSSNKKPQLLTLPYSLTIEKSKLSSIEILNKQGKKNAHIEVIRMNRINISDANVRGTATLILKKPYPLLSHLTLQGKLNNYRIHWIVKKGSDTLILTGQGNTQSINVSFAGSKVYRGDLQGNAQINWYPYLSWNSDIKINNLNLKKFYQALPVINTAEIKSKGDWKKQAPNFDLDAHLKTAKTSIQVQGNHKQIWDLHYSLKSSDLTEINSAYKGKLTSTGRITGSNEKPSISGKLTGSNLRINTLQAGTINTTFNLDLSYQHNSTVKMTGSNIKLNLFKANKLALTANSSPEFKQAQVNLDITDSANHIITLNTSLKGILNPAYWQGTLTELTISSANTGIWKLVKPSPLLLSKEKIITQSSCVKSTSGQICFNINWNKTNLWNIESSGKLINLNLFTGILLKHFKINSQIQYQASIKGNKDKITQLHASITSNRGEIRYNKDFQSLSYPIKHARIEAYTKGDDLVSDISISIAKQDTLLSKISLPDFINNINQDRLKSSKINGSITFTFSSMKLVQILFPTLTQPKGTLTGDLTLDGQLPLPNINGKVSIQNGYVEIPVLKIRLADISTNIHAKNNKLTYEVSAKTSNTPIRAIGTTQYLNNKFISNFTVTGNNILVANTPQYYITASPNLHVRMVGKSLVISGEINIPKARLRPVTFSQATTLPDDTVIINQDDTKTINTSNYVMNVKLTLGNDVKVHARGLNADLQGGIVITHQANQPEAVATGDINLVNASFSAQGKLLQITAGSSVKYTNDILSNPHLSIIASRNVSVVTSQTGFQLGPTKTEVGINIKGTVRHPKVSLFSNPVKLSQADILSYLLFNSPSSGSSLANLSTLLSAVSSLNLSPSNQDSSISSIRQKLGITELGVQQQTYVDALGTPLGVNQSSFVIGSYITPKIYVRYNHGLLSNIDIYQVRYIINKNWAIQTETGTGIQGIGTGVDILYNVSRKKFPW